MNKLTDFFKVSSVSKDNQMFSNVSSVKETNSHQSFMNILSNSKENFNKFNSNEFIKEENVNNRSNEFRKIEFRKNNMRANDISFEKKGIQKNNQITHDNKISAKNEVRNSSDDQPQKVENNDVEKAEQIQQNEKSKNKSDKIKVNNNSVEEKTKEEVKIEEEHAVELVAMILGISTQEAKEVVENYKNTEGGEFTKERLVSIITEIAPEIENKKSEQIVEKIVGRLLELVKKESEIKQSNGKTNANNSDKLLDVLKNEFEGELIKLNQSGNNIKKILSENISSEILKTTTPNNEDSNNKTLQDLKVEEDKSIKNSTKTEIQSETRDNSKDNSKEQTFNTGDGKQTQLSSKEQKSEVNSFKNNLNEVQNMNTENIQSAKNIGKVAEVNKIAKPVNVTQSEIVNQVIDKAKIELGPMKNSMTMQLTPENLGKINLKISTERGIVIASIVAENEAVKEVIENNLQQLKNALEEKGFGVQNLNVSVGKEKGKDNSKNGSSKESNKEGKNIDKLGQNKVKATVGYLTDNAKRLNSYQKYNTSFEITA